MIMRPDSFHDNPPPEWRESTKLIIAGFLAVSTWGVLGWLICSQFNTSVSFAEKIAVLSPTEKDRINLIKDANETVNKTSSSLYAFITPFATAITGYFFISSGILSGKKKEDNPEAPVVLPVPEKSPIPAVVTHPVVLPAPTAGSAIPAASPTKPH
jgi:hypothetical protein